MPELPQALTSDVLSAQVQFVRALARELLRDESEADDVAQDAMVTALRSGPWQPPALRSWLRTVVLNAIRQRHRAAERRTRHELNNAVESSSESAAEIVARMEAHRQLVAAVLELNEAYRTVIVWRFFEGLSADEIAARARLPIETVRTRIKRALAQLRSRLDATYGGERSAWVVALGLVVRAPAPPVMAPSLPL